MGVKVRSWVAVAAHLRGGAGAHDGAKSKKDKRRRNKRARRAWKRDQ